MPERFQTFETEGYLTANEGNSAARPGLSVAVHDAAYRKVVAVFRSEDFTIRRSGHWIARTLARAAAQTECDRLNAKYPEGFPA